MWPLVPNVSPKGTSMEDLTVALVVGNNGEPLSLYEAAVVCKRLATFGWSSQEIARRLGYASAQYVDGLLALAGESQGMNIMCRLGWHKWNYRELHLDEPLKLGAQSLKMVILERCDCGASRIPPHGGPKLTGTGLYASTKFMPGATK